MHTLSPNVYRTLDEAYKTFNWFSEVSSLIIIKHNNILSNKKCNNFNVNIRILEKDRVKRNYFFFNQLGW